jgi:hypothetical protein
MPEERSPLGSEPNKFYLVLFQTGGREELIGQMDRLVVQMIQDKFDEVISSPADQTEIDVWLESPGGDANAAYKLFLVLRSRCRKLRVVIPDYAKSAATLLVLGADEILMAPAAELGPLDVQISHPDREGVSVSGLDVANALSFLGDYATQKIIAGGGEVLRWTYLPRTDVLREFSRFVAQFLRPIAAKLDPHLIHRAKNELIVAQRYAEIMLTERNLAAPDVHKSFDPESFAAHLVRDYPTHDFVISRAEARELRLPVRWAEQYEHWNKVRDMHKAFRRPWFTGEDWRSVIRLFTQSDLGGESEDDEEHPPEEPRPIVNPGSGANGGSAQVAQSASAQGAEEFVRTSPPDAASAEGGQP